MTDGLKDAHREAIVAILAANERVERAVLFGSRATGTHTVSSDVDIALFGDRLTLTDQARIAAALDEIPMAQSVDLLLHEAIKDSATLAHIRHDGIEWYRRPYQSPAVAATVERGGSEDWSEMPLGALVDNFDSIRVPVKQANRVRGPYPYYGASGVVDHVNNYLLEGDYLLIAEDGENLRTRSTPIAFLAGGRFWVNNHAHVVRGNQRADTKFLMYALSKMDISGYLTGSTMPKLTQDNMNQIRLLTPSLSEQRGIARVLGTLDDKIELTRRMNATLEAMAQALFRSWFVDFDPVRAKMEGRETGLPKDIEDLFPDRLMDSDLGDIPDGWRIGVLDDLLIRRLERCHTSNETAALPYVPIDCIPSKSLSLVDSKPGILARSSLTRFYKGDVLFGAMRPYFHKVCIAPFDGTTRTTVLVLYPKRRHDFAFATLLLHHPNTIDFATRHSRGSTIPYAAWEDSMEGMATTVPPPGVLRAFDDIVRPLLECIPQEYFESRTLAAIRDALLPKLVSGGLRVSRREPASVHADRAASVGAHEA